MNTNVSKGSEPFASKIIIILICVLYVIGPLHVEVNNLLHTITHVLEKPDTVLAHQKRSEALKTHNSTKHEDQSLRHDHEIIDLVESILKGSETGKKSPKRPKKLVKIDKHITLQDYGVNEEKNLRLFNKQVFWKKIKNKLHKGYKIGLMKPPRV